MKLNGELVKWLNYFNTKLNTSKKPIITPFYSIISILNFKFVTKRLIFAQITN